MEPEYRPADMIELHDSGYILVRQGVSDVENGWREFVSTGGRSLVIYGEEVEQLLKHLDIEYSPIVKRRGGDKEIRQSLSGSSFTIRQEMTKIGNDSLANEHSQIMVDLSAFVEAPNLLHIKAKFQYDLDDPPTTEFTEKTITYSGRFTVWWSRDDTASS